mmetsp:Transcript_294/g.806  ORF Transcript_294/g.806 Transcript_294/m.806 type:complete len:231 (-) Transcript_294:341-1033(-)
MSNLDNCKVTYFPIAGRAEPLRLALTISGIPFEDIRLKGNWPEVKGSTPWGQVPVLELSDGTRMAQAKSLVRFVGRQTSPQLYPDDPYLAQRVDELVDAVEDMAATVREAGKGLEGDAKLAARKEAAESGTIYAWLAKINGFIRTYGSGGYSIGSQLTTADLALFCSTCSLVSGVFDGIPLDCVNKFTNIQQVRKQVATLPAVMKWYDDKGDSIAESEKAYRDARNITAP